MKLSKAQAEIVKLLQTGEWEAGSYTSLGSVDYRCTIQKGGLGKGGEARRVSKKTIQSLYVNGIIEEVEWDRFHRITKYVLTDHGKSLKI